MHQYYRRTPSSWSWAASMWFWTSQLVAESRFLKWQPTSLQRVRNFSSQFWRKKDWNQNLIRGGEDGHPDLASGGSWATIWSWHAKIGIEIRLSDSFTCGLFGGRDQDQEAPRPPGQCWILVSPRHPAANLQDANQLYCCRRGSG